MSLLSVNMAPCTKKVPVCSKDKEGGEVTRWEDGAAFSAAVVLNTSTQTTVGERDETSDSYTVTTSRAEALRFGEVFERNGETYKVVSAPKMTPEGALLDMAQVTAERWDLPK